MKLSFSSIANLLLLPKNYNIAEYYQEVNEILQSHHVFSHLYQLEQSIQPILKQVERSGLIVASEWFTCGLQEKRNQLANAGSEINHLIASTNDGIVEEVALRKFWGDNDLPIAIGFDALKRYKNLHPTYRLMLDWKNHRNYLKMWRERLIEHGVSMNNCILIKGNWRSFSSYTGRITARNLPLTSMPGAMRNYIVSPKEYQIVSLDLNNAELRFLAHYARCSPLIEKFNAGSDVHDKTSKLIQKVMDHQIVNEELSRNLAKQYTYSFLYGAGVQSIAKNMQKVWSNVTCADVDALNLAFHQQFSELKSFLLERESSEHLLTPFGEIKPVAEFTRTQKRNFPLQSSVSVAIKILLTTLRTYNIEVVHVLHDEVWILTPKEMNVDEFIAKAINKFKEKIKEYFPGFPTVGILSKEKIGGKYNGK